MNVKFILPALTEATSPFWRPIKYSLFPPLGLATLAGYLDPDDEITLRDEHVQKLNLDDHPDLVVIQAYITSAYRAYEIADHYRTRGCHVAIGGLHPSALPEEALAHADTVFIGPGEDSWPAFLKDFRRGCPEKIYHSTKRTLHDMPWPRRDLIRRRLYLVPNSLVVSRGCPHACDFCYKDAFFKGGRSFYTQKVDRALAEIESLHGRHLYFLDDHLFAAETFAGNLFDGMKGMNRLWQGAATVASIQKGDLVDKAARCGLKSLFVGFETLSAEALASQNKMHNLGRDYSEVIRRLRDLGVMVNASFVYGLDGDNSDVFNRTVDWALEQGVETATFHILTPYPGTRLYDRMTDAGRIATTNWNLYDTRHAVYTPESMSREQLETGYWNSYSDFYKWKAIFRGARSKNTLPARLRHLALTAGWKKFEPVWDLIIRTRRVYTMLPFLESILSGWETSPCQNPGKM